MKRILPLLITCGILLSGVPSVKANLVPGAPAQDFTLTDINGQTYNLYSLLNSGKTVYVEFAATWCIFCWNYFNTHAMKDLYEQYGPNGTNEVMVLFIEAELTNTHECLYGSSGCVGPKGGTKGDWVTGMPYPIFDLQPSDASILTNYNPVGYPTIYCICPQTKTVFETGQKTASELYSYINSCALDYHLDNKTNLSCKGDHTGSIEISSYNGIAPLSYKWSNGATTEDISGLSAGTYKLTITDANGVMRTTPNITVTEPAALNIGTTQVTNEGCEGSMGGAINLNTTGGTPGYNFLWSNGAVTEDINNLSAGQYLLAVTDMKGCTATKSYVLSALSIPESDAGDDKSINCITPAVELQGDGTYNAQYKWTTSNGHIISGGNTLYPLVDKGGIYTLTVKYTATGCTASDQMTVLQNTNYPDAIIASPGTINCKDSTVILNGSLSTSGQYIQYKWLTSGGNIIGSTVEKNTLVDAVGKYYLVVENTLNYCKDTNYVQVIKDTIAPKAIIGHSPEINCNLDTITLDGSQSSNDSNILVQWTTLDGHIISGDSTLMPLINKGGIYTILVTNLNNFCSASSSDTISQNPGTYPESIYNYTNALLTVSFHSVSTGIPDTYLWDFGDGTASSEKDPVHTYLVDGTYLSCLTTSNMCGTDSKCQSLIVSSNTNIPNISNINITPVTCESGSDGCIDLSVIYGTAPYSFAWNNGSGFEDPCQLIAGIYSVTVTDANGITVVASNIIVNTTNFISINNAQLTQPECNSSNGALLLNINSNSTQLTYHWSHDILLNAKEAINLAAGSYAITVTDTFGCSTSNSFELEEKAQQLSVQYYDVFCFGDSTGNIDLNVMSGTLPYSYLWNTGEITEDLNNIFAGNYNCQVTDATGCLKTIAIEISQPMEITSTIQITNSDAGQNNGTITISTQGGLPPYTYLWSNGGTSQSINQLAPGDYTISITDGNDCEKVLTATVQELTSIISSPEFNGLLKLYPNPGTGIINIQTTYPNSTLTDLTISDLLGNVVYKSSFREKEFQNFIDLSHFPSGHYILKAMLDNRLITKKILINK